MTVIRLFSYHIFIWWSLFVLVVLSPDVIQEIKRIIEESEILDQSDENWPAPDKVNGKQELEIKIGNQHICFTVRILNPNVFS